MDWLDRMNSAMDYIETNLTENISYDTAARLACCSTYHFQRMFSYITGVTLSEYIRRRRLTLAAFDLQAGHAKVIDIALKYGYDAPEAFTRAFKSLHGVMPSSVRAKNVALKAFPRMTFHISIKGDIEMNYRIETKGQFDMFGVIKSVNREKAGAEVLEFRKACDEDGSVDRMNTLLQRPIDTILHAVLFHESDTILKYGICYDAPDNMQIPDEFERFTVPALTWAIFQVPDCEFQSTWSRIYTEWFPTANYEQVEGPGFEMYYDTNRITGEIWIPVKQTDNADL